MGHRCFDRFAGALALFTILLATPGSPQVAQPSAGTDALWVVHDLTTAQTYREPWPTEAVWRLLRLTLLSQGAGVPGYSGSRGVTIQKVFPPDTRQRRDTTEYPWSAQCRIWSHFPSDPPSIVEHCSGTLIAPGYVLTAGHCVYQPACGGLGQRHRSRAGSGRRRPAVRHVPREADPRLSWLGR